VDLVREFAPSRDGTKVPLNILRRKGTALDGKNPTLLTGYGGYGVNLSPRYQPLVRLWLEQGGIYAEANLRGGGEYGEAWHQAGMLAKKQNVFDDFIACAEHLVARGYTRPESLAIRGGSNGGLLMGAVLTQRPGLAAAVVARVGIFDMLRVELDPNGSFNVTEFGTVKDPEQFKALRAYSPYHNVKDGTPYPAVLLTTGVHDPRVDPRHPRKMAARLQAATSSRKPILLRVNQGGHGLSASLDERIDEEADVHGFLFEQLGMRFKPAPARSHGGSAGPAGRLR
jgi:prolyl oligopeptidase